MHSIEKRNLLSLLYDISNDTKVIVEACIEEHCISDEITDAENRINYCLSTIISILNLEDQEE